MIPCARFGAATPLRCIAGYQRESTPLVYLRLFGGLSLEEDGGVLTGRATQKRRLAVLALLATAPGRTLSRDRITGLLWPEREDDQARHLLNVAAYEIRRELGDDAVVTRGDDLYLDPLAVGADTDDFDAALDSGDFDAAMALYRGPFLDGFFLGGSAEFDHWVDEQRNLYARRYRKALVARAEAIELSGDAAAAADAWRKAANEDRFDSRVALRLLRAMDAAGNRIGALQFARIHESLLREEFGTTPDQAFTDAVEEIRAGTTAPPPSGKPAAPPPTPPATASNGPEAAPPEVPAGSGAGASMSDSPDAAGSGPAGPAADAAAGVPRTTPPSAGGIGGTGAGRRVALGRRGWMVGVVLLVLLLIAAAVASYVREAGRAATPPAPIRVLVLPLSPADEEEEPLADWLSESILDVLAQVEGVRVPAWSAALSLRGASAPEAARQTGVHYVVEGTLRREVDSLWIRVALVGADGDIVTRKAYHRPAGAMRATEAEIAADVLENLRIEHRGIELRTAAGDTDVDAARDRFEKGRHEWLKRTPDGLRSAIRYFHDAVELDPEYARAHAGLADAYNLLGDYLYGVLPPDSAYPLARAAAERALRLEPHLGEARAALAIVLYQYDRDFEAADAAFRMAIELKPHYAEAHHWYSLFLLASGREEESLAEVHTAIQLDSLSPIMRTSLGRHNHLRGEAARALEEYQRAMEMDPGFVTGLLGAGVALLELGRYDEAIEYFASGARVVGGRHPLAMALTANAHGRAGRPEEARRILAQLEAARSAGQWIPPEWLALVHIGLGDHDAAIAAFEQALEGRSSAAPFLGIDPLARPLWDDPRFRRLIERGRRPA